MHRRNIRSKDGPLIGAKFGYEPDPWVN